MNNIWVVKYRKVPADVNSRSGGGGKLSAFRNPSCVTFLPHHPAALSAIESPVEFVSARRPCRKVVCLCKAALVLHIVACAFVKKIAEIPRQSTVFDCGVTAISRSGVWIQIKRTHVHE